MSASGDEKKSINVKTALAKIKQAKIDKTAADQTAREQTKIREPGTRTISRTKKVKKSPSSQPVPGQNITTINLTKTADKLYGEAGYIAKTGLDQKPVQPTLSQLKARLGLAIIEPIIGGAEEATLGISGTIQSRQRPATALLRIVGGVATPTAADALIGIALQKLGISSRARALLKKIELVLTEIDDPLFGEVVNVANKLTKSDVRFITEMDELGLLPRNQQLGVDAAVDLNQLLKMNVPPSASQFEDIITTLRRGDLAPPISGKGTKLNPKTVTGDLKAARNQMGKVVDTLITAFKQSVDVTTDPKRAGRIWEEGITQARRLSESTIGPKRLPLLEIDFPGGNIESGTITEVRRNALKLLDLRSALSKGTRTKEAIKNFIEFTLEEVPGKTRRGFTTLAPPDLTKIPNAANDLINFIENNPTVFEDGALFSWMVSGLNDKDAKKVLKSTTSLPDSDINKIAAAIEASSGPPGVFPKPPKSKSGPKGKKDQDLGSFSVFAKPPWLDGDKDSDYDGIDEESGGDVPVGGAVSSSKSDDEVGDIGKGDDKTGVVGKDKIGGIDREKDKDKEEEKTDTDEDTKTKEDTTPDEDEDTTPKEDTTPDEDTGEDTGEDQDTIPDEITDQPDPTEPKPPEEIPEPIEEEPIQEEEPVPVPTKTRDRSSIVDEEEAPSLPKHEGIGEYLVAFIFVNGVSESHVVEADGYFEALDKGEKALKRRVNVLEVEITPQ